MDSVWINSIIIAVVLAIVAAVGVYLYRVKKRGQACVGCPYSKECSKRCKCSGQ